MSEKTTTNLVNALQSTLQPNYKIILSPETKKQFLCRLWDRQKESGLSDRALAKELGLDNSTLSYVKRGKREIGDHFIQKVLARFPDLAVILSEPASKALSPEQVKNKQLVQHFLDAKSIENLSIESLRFYETYLRNFIKTFPKDLRQATPQDIRTFLASLKCQAGGKHAYFRALRSFYNFLEREGLIDKSPLANLKPPKVPKTLMPYLNELQIKTILNACENLRDKALVMLFLDTGIRLSEIANIKLADIDWQNQTIKIWGKGAKQRIVKFGERTKQTLIEYLNTYQPNHMLWDINKWGIVQMLKRLSRKTGIRECHAHNFRRTFATVAIKNMANPFFVQSLLGHTTLTMTRRYSENVNSLDAIKAYIPILS